MKRIYHPARTPEDWRELLAAPDRQWKDGHSAKELAYAWDAADGWPTEIASLLESGHDWRELKPVLAIPEYKVPLPGGGNPSQNDLFVLAADHDGLVSILVEGKASEPFGESLGQWRLNGSPGKAKRLSHLQAVLDLPGPLPDQVRYQLLHRTASALIEAERFHARAAIMLVHSFSATGQWFEDYAAFLALYGVSASPGRLHLLSESTGVPLYAGWAAGIPRTR
jgi:hypothetical protein